MTGTKNQYERIPLSDKHNLCGVLLWTMDLFKRFGYLRPFDYDKNIWTKLIYHLRTVSFISSHFGKNTFYYWGIKMNNSPSYSCPNIRRSRCNDHILA